MGSGLIITIAARIGDHKPELWPKPFNFFARAIIAGYDNLEIKGPKRSLIRFQPFRKEYTLFLKVTK